jgi:hypothetical protein
VDIGHCCIIITIAAAIARLQRLFGMLEENIAERGQRAHLIFTNGSYWSQNRGSFWRKERSEIRQNGDNLIATMGGETKRTVGRRVNIFVLWM